MNLNVNYPICVYLTLFILIIYKFSPCFADDLSPNNDGNSTIKPALNTNITVLPIISAANHSEDQKHTESVSESSGSVDNHPTKENNTNLTSDISEDNCKVGGKGKNCTFYSNIMTKMSENREMLIRTMYVLFGVSGIVVLYYIVKSLRLRHKKGKSRKYGIIASRGDMEMEPLGEEDVDDEDYTVFEMNSRPK